MPIRPAGFGPRALSVARDLLSLTKPGIVLLLLVTGYCAMVVAHGGVPGLEVTAVTLIGLGLSAGGANAVNMWYDRDIDPIMHRTRGRPVPSGRLAPATALWFGILAQAVSLVLLYLAVGWLTALLSFAGFVYYVFIYTMWLKRRTPLNIVIGGGAGAFPPLVGWAAITGHVGWPAIIMFGIVFLWTPPHFWSLALYREGDYAAAGVPMMPVVRGAGVTKRQSLSYGVLLLLVSALLYMTGTVGVVYLAVAVLLGLGFIGYLVQMLRERAPDAAWAKRTFRYSLIYLAGVFAFMVLNVRH